MTNFEKAYGKPSLFEATACGRVNLIGEHTDYNGGLVLPTAIPQVTRVALAPRGDGQVRVISSGHPEDRVEFPLGAERRTGGWADYVQGVTTVLRSRGYRLGGFDAAVASDVPMGSGLSSSAALDVAFMRALRAMFGLRLDDILLARLCQAVENEFVGARVGILDPMAISLASYGNALFLDTHSMAHETIPLPLDRADLLVINSGVAHRNAGGGYNARRAECDRACRLLNVGELREVGLADLPRIARLPEPFNRRARHVVTENDRVLRSVEALRAGDLARLGRLFLDSHVSLRDDYEVSVPEIDALVNRLAAEPEVFGARITGGGFGGSVVALAAKGKGAAVAERVTESYRRSFSAEPTILVPPRH